MKIILIIIITIFYSNNLYAYKDLFESNFVNINIITKDISLDKQREIDKVKISSFYSIIEKILTKENLSQFKRQISIESEINYLIKNIIIENEFISNEIYSADIKVNFVKKDIINLLKNNQINYADLLSPNILLIVIEGNALLNEGLSKNNSFYKNYNSDRYGLINLLYPDLSPNDRFILPYNKIKNLDLESLNKISKKYKTDYLLLIDIHNNNFTNFIDIKIFSSFENRLIKIDNFSISKDLDYTNKLFSKIEDWWKNLNTLDLSIINKKLCYIENSNIHELYYIISQIKKISQLETLNLIKINLGKNLYEIVYYGEEEKFSLKLANHKIKRKININNQCTLFASNL